MRVTLIHNPKAGKGHPIGAELQALIEEAGHKVRYQSSKEKKWARALKRETDLVVIAGGDGTIRKVATRLAGRRVPITILPLGTANNIAKSLGINGTLAQLVAGWAGAPRRPVDVGIVCSPWGRTRFIEGLGCGLFTDVMAALDAKKKRRPKLFKRTNDPLGLALRTLHDALADYRAFEVQATLDDEDIQGRYLMLEAMNICHIGPNLLLAPDADAGDGLLDFVLLTEDRREEFADYLAYRLEGKQEAPFLPVRRGKCLKLNWSGWPLRVDDKLWPKLKKDKQRKRKQPFAPATIEIRLKRQTLEFLTPATDLSAPDNATDSLPALTN
jgi:diacylglycerol kinase family enzyme